MSEAPFPVLFRGSLCHAGMSALTAFVSAVGAARRSAASGHTSLLLRYSAREEDTGTCLSELGESAGSASPKSVWWLPCTLADYGGVCSSALHLAAASLQEFSWSWHFIMEFLFQL